MVRHEGCDTHTHTQSAWVAIGTEAGNGQWCSYNLHWLQSSREELLDDIEELKKKVTGASDKLSS